MPVKQTNVRPGGRFLSVFFVIIRTFLQSILNLAPAHTKKFPDVSRHSGRCTIITGLPRENDPYISFYWKENYLR